MQRVRYGRFVLCCGLSRVGHVTADYAVSRLMFRVTRDCAYLVRNWQGAKEKTAGTRAGARLIPLKEVPLEKSPPLYSFYWHPA